MTTPQEAAEWLYYGAKGAPYFPWPGGEVSPGDGPPAWADNAPAPPIELVREQGGFCVAVVSLIQRKCGVPIPNPYNDPAWDGGTRATYDAYYDDSYFYSSRRGQGFENFDLLVTPWREGGGEGHAAVVWFYEGEPYVLEWIHSGLTWDFTVDYSNTWGAYEIVVPADVWLASSDEPGDEKPAPGRTDEELARLIDPYLGGYGALIVEKARKHGLHLALGCAVLEQETLGRNIFGCDHGDVGDRPPYCQQEVTYERVQALRDGGDYTYGMNGIGLPQVTWWEFVETCEKMGGAHLPDVQVDWAFGWLKHLLLNYDYGNALEAYNDGDGSWNNPLNNYDVEVAAKHEAWKEYLGNVKPGPEPEPKPEEEDLSFAIYTFAASGPVATDIANAATMVLEHHGIDALPVNGDDNIQECSRRAFRLRQTDQANCIVVGEAALTRVHKDAREAGAVGWDQDDTVWFAPGVNELTFVRNWCLPWIMRHNDAAVNEVNIVVNSFENQLLALDATMYRPMIEASRRDPDQPPPPPPPPPQKSVEEMLADHEERLKNLERTV